MPEIKLCAFADESGNDLRTQADNLIKNGIYNIEIRNVDGINIGDMPENKAKEAYKILSGLGISVWSLGSPLGKIEVEKPFSEHEKLLYRLMKTADIMHTDRIRIFSYFVKREDYKKYRGTVIERLNKLSQIAKGYKLCHENESEIYGATVDNCVDIYDNISYIHPVFDSSNFIMWDEDIEYAYDKLYSRAYYFHVKDSLYKTKQIVPAGEGDGLYDKIVKSLDRDATFTIEPHLHIFSGYNGIDKKELNNKYRYNTQQEAFKAAADSFKNILIKNGYIEGEKGIWIK